MYRYRIFFYAPMSVQATETTYCVGSNKKNRNVHQMWYQSSSYLALAWDYFVAHAQKSVKWDHQCAWNVAVCFKQLKLSYCLVACVNLMKKTTFHLYSCLQSFDNVSNHNPWVETNTQLTGEIIFKLQKSWKEKVRLHQKQWNQYFHSNVL